MSKEWVPLVSREESPLWVSLVCKGSDEKFFKTTLDWDYGIQHYKYEGSTHFISLEDAAALQALVDSFPGTTMFYHDYLNCCKKACGALDNLEIPDKAIGDLAIEEAQQSLTRFIELTLNVMPFLPSLVLIQDKLEDDLRDLIARKINSDSDSETVSRLLSDLLIPSRNASVVEETRSLASLAAECERRGLGAEMIVEKENGRLREQGSARYPELRDQIKRHIDDFGWLGTFTYLGAPFSFGDILGRLKAALERGDCESRWLKKRFRIKTDLKKAKESMKALNLKSEEQRLVKLAQEYLFWRFERVDVNFRTEVRLRSIEQCIGKAFHLSREQLVALSYTEILALMGTNEKKVTRNILNGRLQKGFAVRKQNKSISLWIENSAPVDNEDEFLPDVSSIRGQTACKGLVEGKARIVNSPAEMDKVEHGDIIVTPMTTPDLMVAIEKAFGIITDEGGILCHAAIISREMNIPCIIGTKYATSVITDGSVIQLDARKTQGEVNLLGGDP